MLRSSIIHEEIDKTIQEPSQVQRQVGITTIVQNVHLSIMKEILGICYDLWPTIFFL